MPDPRDYDSWYDTHFRLFQAEIQAAKPHLIPGPGLEIGVGTGRFAEALGLDFGLDLWVEGLAMARSRGISVVAGDCAELPFKDNVFANVGIFFALEFFSRSEPCLRETVRVMRVRGKLLIMAFDPNAANTKNILKKRRDPGSSFYGINVYSQQDITNMARGVRFEHVEQIELAGAVLMVGEKIR